MTEIHDETFIQPHVAAPKVLQLSSVLLDYVLVNFDYTLLRIPL